MLDKSSYYLSKIDSFYLDLLDEEQITEADYEYQMDRVELMTGEDRRQLWKRLEKSYERQR